MRGAFLIRLQAESDGGRLVGRIEEVDSGKEITFLSAEELLSFLSERLAAAQAPKNCDLACMPVEQPDSHK